MLTFFDGRVERSDAVGVHDHALLAAAVHDTAEELEADYCICDYDKENKNGDVKQRYHRSEYGVQDHLETFESIRFDSKQKLKIK